MFTLAHKNLKRQDQRLCLRGETCIEKNKRQKRDYIALESVHSMCREQCVFFYFEIRKLFFHVHALE